MSRNMSRRKRWCIVGICICIFWLGSGGSGRKALAAVRIATFQELKQVLGQEGRERVELSADLSIEGPVIIRGDKEIDGRGHCLERSKKKANVYGGCLFQVRGNSCEWKNITISGGGKNKQLAGKIFGRLAEVRRGELIIGKDCILRDNINDQLAVDGGGALLIGAGGKCIMRAGVIRGCQTIAKGAGVAVEKGGFFTMKGGSIEDNIVTGAGAVEGFDGRGGAIYSEGSVSLAGGSIKGNQARAYMKGSVQYGGAGAAVYAEAGSVMEIEGGVFAGNRDDRGYPIWISGQLNLGGKPILERIHLQKGRIIRIHKSFHPVDTLAIQPSVYAQGIHLASGKKVSVTLAEKKGYGVKWKNGGCYIMKSKKKSKDSKKQHIRKNDFKKSEKGKQNKRKNEKKTVPVIQCKQSQFEFYEGERVSREVLLTGVSAVDDEEGDITEKLRLLEPKQLDTGQVGTGTILYEVKNKKGVCARKKSHYRIRKNRPPTIQTASRYLFVWEVEGFTEKQWKELILEECFFSDDCETAQELRDATTVEYKDFEKPEAGTFEIEVTVQDQIGHRFYMEPGESRRYGEGHRVTAKISVTLVDNDELETQDLSHVRFTEPGKEQTMEEEWFFSSGQIRQIQTFMNRRRDPFSAETNQEFLQLYRMCRRYKEEVEDE